MWLFLCCYIFVNYVLVSPEVITLMKDNNITCIARGDSVNNAIYLMSPNNFINIDREILKINKWEKSDWKNTAQNDTFEFNFVTDERWMDSMSRRTIRLYNNKSQYFSVCLSDSADLNIRVFPPGIIKLDYNYNLTFTTKAKLNRNQLFCEWNHFVLRRHDSSLTLNPSRENITEIVNYQPEWFIIKSKSYKVYNANFLYSDSISSSKSVVTFESFTCVSVYVSVDLGCYLNITLKSKSKPQTITVQGFNEKNALKKWKNQRITYPGNGEKKLSFYRGREDNKTNGFWAIDDLRTCKDNMEEVYSTVIENVISKEYLCKSLDTENETLDVVSTVNKESNITCAEVFGFNYSHYEKHKICCGNDCHCAWGYQGANCNETCALGHWGLNCKKTCDQDCEQCDNILGCQKCEANIFEELPKDIIFLRNGVNMTLHACNRFNRSINYYFQFECISNWCKHTDNINKSYKLQEYKPVSTFNLVNLLPFTAYNVIVKEENTINPIYFNRTTPPIEPRAVENLTVYKIDNNALYIRWTQHYPPTGRIEFYNLTVNQKHQNQSQPNKCELWDNFYCAGINGLGNISSYDITMSIKNADVLKWSPPTIIKGEVQNVTGPPQNVTIMYSFLSNATILSWEHPLFTHGEITEFLIEINNFFFKNVTKDQYSLPIPVECGEKYFISVGANSGQKANILAVTSEESKDFPHCRLVGYCPRDCYLAEPNNEETMNKYQKQQIKPKKDCTKMAEVWQCKINASMLISHSKKNKTIESNMTTITILVLVIPLTILIFGSSYLYYAFKCQKFPFKKNNFIESITRSKSIELINFSTLLENQTLLEPKKIELSEPEVIKIDSFKNYLFNVLEEDSDNNNITRQFETVAKTNRTDFACGYMKNNAIKNRYKNVLPYDYNRVVLKKMEGLGTNDYINASYISSLNNNNNKTYIATQGPKFSTIKDFWRMIWQEQVEAIVMATNFMEDNKRKCAEYFPQASNETFECGEMLIKFTKEENYEYYIVRHFDLIYRKIQRKVQHFQLKWEPNPSTPLYANCVVPLIKKIRLIRETSNRPIVIHCSSGINRTGILILCDLALQMIKETKVVDFFTLVKRLREQRPNMVSSKRQYILTHLIVLECVMEEENTFKSTVSENLKSARLKSQLNYLEHLSWHDDIVQCWTPNQRYASNLHFYSIDGYTHSNKFVCTALPDKDFINQFWTAINNENIHTILLLNKPKYQIWPYSIQSNSTSVTVEEHQTVETTYCTSTQLILRVVQTGTHNLLLNRSFNIFQVNEKNVSLQDITLINNILNILEDINQNFSKLHPILIAYNDGVTTCGVFLALDYIIQKWIKELEVDVCNAIRTIRRSGLPFVKTIAELRSLYIAVIEYLQKFDKYSSIL